MSLLAASVPYAEIAFFGVLVIALIIGAVRGFSKSFKGFFLGIAIILIAACLVSPSFDTIRGISVFDKMEDAITQGISKEEFMTYPIYNSINPETGEQTQYIEIQDENNTTYRISLDEAIANGNLSRTKARLVSWLANQFITEDGRSLGGVAGKLISDVIVAAIIFVVYCIAFGIVCAIIRAIFKKMRNSEHKALRVVDHTLGAIITTGFALLFIFVVLAIFDALKDKIPVVHDALSEGPVCGFFYQNNPLIMLWHKLFG